MKNVKCNVGDVVRVEAFDTTEFSGKHDEYPLMSVYVYGRVGDIINDTIVIIMAEDKSGIKGDFDERIVFPMGCIIKVDVLIKGEK